MILLEFEYNAVRVVTIIDGDTLRINIDLGFHTHRVTKARLYGVDTPELSVESQEADAEAATNFVKDRLKENNYNCSVKTLGKGARGRYETIVQLEDSDLNLNQELVKNGHMKKGFEPAREAIPPNFININEADYERLQWIPNIGPSLAQKVMDKRQEIGELTLKNLDEVSGIGEATLEDMIDFIKF